MADFYFDSESTNLAERKWLSYAAALNFFTTTLALPQFGFSKTKGLYGGSSINHVTQILDIFLPPPPFCYNKLLFYTKASIWSVKNVWTHSSPYLRDVIYKKPLKVVTHYCFLNVFLHYFSLLTFVKNRKLNFFLPR